MLNKIMVRSVLAAAVLASAVAVCADTIANVFNMPAGETSLDFVTVGNPGNAADPLTGHGSVGYTYQIGEYDVTVDQYCQFLDAVAKVDTYGLYTPYMATDYPTVHVTRSGSVGSYTYAVTGSYGKGVNCPIFDVTWADAARFCNWLQNGQPVGPEGNGTTETGAYTLNGAMSLAALMAVTRNNGAKYFIPAEDEWSALSENWIMLGGQGHEAMGQLEDFSRQPPRGGKRR